MLSDRTLAHGMDAARALLGVDALYREESGDDVGLAVLNMDVEGAIRPETFDDYAEAEARWAALEAEAAGLPEPDRRRYYAQLAGSTRAFIAWRSNGLGFREQLNRFLHVPAAPASDGEVDALRAELRTLLGRQGYTGDLAAQCAAWEERNRVPPDDVGAVLQELMDEAWDRTDDRLLSIPADRDDRMRVSTVSGMAFNARCDYMNRTVEVNTDPVLTRPGLKHLAVHEGCPGHYVQFKLRETLFREGRAAADVMLSVVNTASSSVFEGIADAGMAMVDWSRDDDDRIQALLNRHRAGIGTGAAWRLHALGRSFDDTADWLRSACLVGGEGWVRNRMAFIAAPSRAVLIWSYWWGERSVLPMWEAVPVDRRAEFLVWLHGRMHSVDTVGMFDGTGTA